MRHWLVAVFLSVLWANTCCAQITIGKETLVEFASVQQARKVLLAEDDFVRRMSPFDLAARMKTDQAVARDAYFEFVGRQVLEWNDSEKQHITSALRGLEPKLKAFALPLPKKVLIIKTTGREEGNAAYTRGNAVILPQAILGAAVARIQRTICHELFHVLSRANPDLREKLYAAIGFAACREVAFPPELKARKITNPDAPRNDHCIRLRVAGQQHWAVPILFSRTETYDVKRGGEFFNYLQFRFLLVERSADSPVVKPLYDGGRPRLAGLQDVTGFFEQVGKNTRYIIHPEEILADNFAILVLKPRSVPSPEIVKKMEKILTAR